MMNKVVAVCKCLCLLSLSFLFVKTALVVQSLPAELVATRQAILGEVALAKVDVLSTVARVSNEAMGTLDRRLGSIQADVNAQVEGARSEITPSLVGTMEAYGKLPASIVTLNNNISQQVERVSPYTDCAVNDLCFQKLAVRTMASTNAAASDFSRSAHSISKAMPEIAENVKGVTAEVRGSAEVFNRSWPSITNNADQITGSVNRILAPRWYDRIVKYGLTGAVIYGTVRP